MRRDTGSPPHAWGQPVRARLDHHHQFKVVFDAICELMTPPQTNRRRIGFSRD